MSRAPRERTEQSQDAQQRPAQHYRDQLRFALLELALADCIVHIAGTPGFEPGIACVERAKKLLGMAPA